MIRIDKEKCTECNTCTQHCPGGFITEGPQISDIAQKYCVRCGHCLVVCPSEAIQIASLENLYVPPYAQEIPVSPQAMDALLRRRRSIRQYKPKPVSREHLGKIIEAASQVPSAHNFRAFKAYVCSDKAVISQVHKRLTEHYARSLDAFKKPIEGMSDSMREELLYAFDYLIVNPPEGKDSLFWNARTLLVFTSTIPHPLCIGDAWIASFAAVMYAETIPVGTCYNGFLIMGLIEDPSIKPLLKIPEEELVVSAFTLGYPDEKHFRYPPRRTMETTWI